MVDNKSALTTLEDHLPVLIDDYHVRRIGLFGSCLRNEATLQSDIDILVEFETGQKKFSNYMELLFHLESLFERPVDLILSDALKPDLKTEILASVKYATPH